MEFNQKGLPEAGKAKLQALALAKGWYGGNHIASVLDRALVYKVRKIPTGIFQLDWFSQGGIPIGRITRLAGRRNSCKTTIMLKVIANSQKWCRYCKQPIVVSPETGEKECQCPNPRYKLEDKTWTSFLSYEEATLVQAGALPLTVKKEQDRFFLEINKKKIYFEETFRCSPFQTLLLETEHKLDELWARKNGVDTSLVVVVGCDWGEKAINAMESILSSGEIDLVCVDTLTFLTSRDSLEKDAEDRKKIASRATIIARLFEKLVGIQYADGLLCDTQLTVLCNSQVRMVDIGQFTAHVGVADGNVPDHLVAMDIFLYEKGYSWVHKEYASYGKFNFTIKKNHTGGSSGVSGNFQLWLDPNGPYSVGDTDDFAQVVAFGRKLGIIQEGKSKEKYFFLSSYAKTGKFLFATLKELEEFLVKNSSVYQFLRSQVLEGMKNIRTVVKDKEGTSEVTKAE